MGDCLSAGSREALSHRGAVYPHRHALPRQVVQGFRPPVGFIVSHEHDVVPEVRGNLAKGPMKSLDIVGKHDLGIGKAHPLSQGDVSRAENKVHVGQAGRSEVVAPESPTPAVLERVVVVIADHPEAGVMLQDALQRASKEVGRPP